MDHRPSAADRTDPTAGLGLKAQYYEDALASRADGLWFEVHAENYMVDGGPRLAWLEAIRRDKPLSLHGVGLSLAADARPDRAHLLRLKALADRYAPFVVSEHLAWSSRGGHYRPDLLPFPRTRRMLDQVCDNISEAQEVLGRRLLIENPAHYLPLRGHDLDEPAFLAEMSARTGCGLLVDVANVALGASNLGFSAVSWLDAIPGEAVGELHLAGSSPDPEWGEALLIDSHATPVSEPVWALYAHLIGRIGPRPTLIERDDALPPFETLMAERDRADGLLRDLKEARRA